MGLLGNIMEAAPGVMAQGFAGAAQGQQIATERQQREQQATERRERAIREEMLRQAALDLQKRQAELAERREDRLAQPRAEAPYDPATDEVLLREQERRRRGWVGGEDASLTPGQAATQQNREATRIREEALGNAVTWIRAEGAEGMPTEADGGAQLDRNRVIDLIKTQHNIPVGEAARIYERAYTQVHGQPSRRPAGSATGGGSINVGGVDLGSGASTQSRTTAVRNEEASARRGSVNPATDNNPTPAGEGGTHIDVSAEVSPSLPTDEADQARRMVSHLPSGEKRAALKEVGYTDVEIRQILGS